MSGCYFKACAICFSGIKQQQHRKSTDRHKPYQPLRMLFHNDPLNLASLSGKTDACESPENSSPILDRSHEFEPANILPIDVSDPLNLNCGNEDVFVLKPPRKKRKRKRRNTYNGHDEEHVNSELVLRLSDSSSVLDNNDLTSPIELPILTRRSPKSDETVKHLTNPETNVIDKPIVTDPVYNIKNNTNVRHQQFNRKISMTSSDLNTNFQRKHFNVKNKKYQYGNYKNFYDNSLKEDQRLNHFRKEWFENKHCLDIGCNTGLLTCWIADNFNPESIVGVDIDSDLIKIAKQKARQRPIFQRNIKKFPLSLELTHGPITMSKFLNHSVDRGDIIFQVVSEKYKQALK